jgi:hypothetical protein
MPIMRLARAAVSGFRVRRASASPASSVAAPALRTARPAFRVAVAATSVAASPAPPSPDLDRRRRSPIRLPSSCPVPLIGSRLSEA